MNASEWDRKEKNKQRIKTISLFLLKDFTYSFEWKISRNNSYDKCSFIL